MDRDDAAARRPSLGMGLLAGAIGGIAGSVAKALAEAAYPPRIAGEVAPPIVLIRKITGTQLLPDQEKLALLAIHYAFGTLTGAAYGAIAEIEPRARYADGLAFGLALNLATHESVLPALGLSASPLRQQPREQSSEAITHAVYGIVTESVRSAVRGAMVRGASRAGASVRPTLEPDTEAPPAFTPSSV